MGIDKYGYDFTDADLAKHASEIFGAEDLLAVRKNMRGEPNGDEKTDSKDAKHVHTTPSDK